MEEVSPLECDSEPLWSSAPPARRGAPSPPHLADSDDSLLGDLVSEDVKHVHPVAADDGEEHLGVPPDVSVGGLDSPHWSSGLGGLGNSELVDAWKKGDTKSGCV